VGTEHILIGVVRKKAGVAAQVLINLIVNLDEVREEVLNVVSRGIGDGDETERADTSNQESKTPASDSFRLDLTDRARRGGIDPLIARKEMGRVIEILSRRTNNCCLLVGNSGVGKTAIVERLAQMIVNGRVPAVLRDRRIVVLDLTRTLVGMTKLGQFVERLNAVADEARRASNTILFMDDFHTLVGNVGAKRVIDASNAVKAVLGRCGVQFIAAMSTEDDRRCLWTAEALAPWFQTVEIEPPSNDQALDMLRVHRDRYESRHRVRIKDEALKTAVELADPFMPGGNLPEQAIDLIHEAAAMTALKATTLPPDLRNLNEQIERLQQELEEAVANLDFERAVSLRDLADNLKKKKENTIRGWREHSREIDGTVSAAVIAEVVSRKTGIPL
jgi:ATP-dependent Clp protease ATP-binding subunit ClpC